MEQIVLIVHVLAALAIIALILIQQGKGADMGASFGAGASQTLFGSTGGGNALTKGTAILATLFFATSFGLAVIAKNMASSAGQIDLPVPAVVESKELPQSQGGGDIPAIEADGSAMGSDIPAIDVPEAPESDIPQ